jgi:hypothetical protein
MSDCSTFSIKPLILHRFPIQCRVIRTIRHPVAGATVRMNCLYRFRSGNAHQRTVLTALFEFRSGQIQNRAFLVAMHPVSNGSQHFLTLVAGIK